MSFWPACMIGTMLVVVGLFFEVGSTPALVCTFMGLGIQLGALLRGVE